VTTMPGPEPVAKPVQVLVFRLDGMEMGMPIEPVIEIVHRQGTTPVPHSSPLVEGIFPLRGRMVTVIDLRRSLALPARRSGTRSPIIVLDSGGDLVGLVVDSVARVAPSPNGVSSLDLEGLLKGLV
jgi:purine-binding chemotaxis protein CheW